MRHFFTLGAVMFLLCVRVDAQTGGVTLKGTVSETVALSISPNFTQNNVDVLSRFGSTVRIMLSGDDTQSSVIRVPLLVRSNSSFKVSAVFESKTAVLTELAVVDARVTGTLASPQVVNALDVRSGVDLDTAQPLLVLSGPRVSLGGTLNSPNNALQVTLLIRIESQPGQRSLAQLTFTGTAGPPIQ